MGSRNRNSRSTWRSAISIGWRNMYGNFDSPRRLRGLGRPGGLPYFALLACGLLHAQWTPELSMRVKTVTAPAPSPDGKLAAWTQTQAVMDGEKSEMLTHVFLAHADGSGRLQLTRGEKSANAPAFSPDSAWVFFASERSGKRNLYRIAVDGGEAEALTNWTGTLGTYSVSPDGKWIAFTGREGDPAEETAKKQKLDFKVIDENPKNQS